MPVTEIWLIKYSRRVIFEDCRLVARLTTASECCGLLIRPVCKAKTKIRRIKYIENNIYLSLISILSLLMKKISVNNIAKGSVKEFSLLIKANAAKINEGMRCFLLFALLR